MYKKGAYHSSGRETKLPVLLNALLSSFFIRATYNLPGNTVPSTLPIMRIFIHGLLSSSQAFKANYLRQHFFPDLVSPDFPGTLDVRMGKLDEVLGDASDITIIGSSFGGLMGALFTCAHPQRVVKLILLAPALVWPDFADNPPAPVSVPTIVYHGRQDDIVPLAPTKALAEQVFTNLTYHEVDDDHSLHATVQALDWLALVGDD